MPSLQLVDEIEASLYLRISRSFLRQARVRGNGPKFSKIGRAVRYRVVDLDEWVEKNSRINTIRLKARQ